MRPRSVAGSVCDMWQSIGEHPRPRTAGPVRGASGPAARVCHAVAAVAVALGALVQGTSLVQAAGLAPAGAADTTNNGDNARDGWYPDEPNLSPASITSGDFGQLFSTQLDRGSLRPAPARRRRAGRDHRGRLDLRAGPGERGHPVVTQRGHRLQRGQPGGVRGSPPVRDHRHPGGGPEHRHPLLHRQAVHQRRHRQPPVLAARHQPDRPGPRSPTSPSCTRARPTTTRPRASTPTTRISVRACSCWAGWSTPPSGRPVTTGPTRGG